MNYNIYLETVAEYYFVMATNTSNKRIIKTKVRFGFVPSEKKLNVWEILQLW